MSVALSQDENVALIRLEGAIDIGVAAELKALLSQALNSRGEICVSLEAATALDVTSFQLLWSAEREALQAGLKFAITPELSEPLRSSLECLGLGEQLAGQL